MIDHFLENLFSEEKEFDRINYIVEFNVFFVLFLLLEKTPNKYERQKTTKEKTVRLPTHRKTTNQMGKDIISRQTKRHTNNLLF